MKRSRFGGDTVEPWLCVSGIRVLRRLMGWWNPSGWFCVTEAFVVEPVEAGPGGGVDAIEAPKGRAGLLLE